MLIKLSNGDIKEVRCALKIIGEYDIRATIGMYNIERSTLDSIAETGATKLRVQHDEYNDKQFDYELKDKRLQNGIKQALHLIDSVKVVPKKSVYNFTAGCEG